MATGDLFDSPPPGSNAGGTVGTDPHAERAAQLPEFEANAPMKKIRKSRYRNARMPWTNPITSGWPPGARSEA